MYKSLIAAIMLPVGLAACASRSAAPAPSTRPPNVVFIMADDLGWGDIEPYGQGKIRTPNLRRMASEGLRFTSFYAGSTVCAPSRSALMTGQHTGHTPVRGNRKVPLPAEVVTLAEVFDRAGYATGAFGKWGLGLPGDEGSAIRQGFDEFFGYLNQSRAHFYYPEWLIRGEERVMLPGNRVQATPRTPGAGPAIERGIYSHDLIIEEALGFIDRHGEEPFFLYLPITIPHADLEVPEEALEPYLDAQGNSIFPETPYPGGNYSPQRMPKATFAAMVTHMDRDVGRILDKLTELGLDENTIVFFTSDNGPHREAGHQPEFFQSNGPFRGVKRDLYEGGIRVPMLLWGPGWVPAGQVSDQVWALWDVLPTAAELVGAPAPPEIDGISMVNAITGRGDQQDHEYLYWEFYERGSAQAVRMGQWKAVRRPMLTGPIELYDLETDLREEHDVAARHPEIVARIEEILAQAHTPSPDWKVPAR